MVAVGNGSSSPYASFAFVIIISVAMRYGYVLSAISAVVIIGVNCAWILSDHAPFSASFVFASGFLCLASVLASYLREQAKRAELALEGRLRQATLLNEAMLLLAGNLDLGVVIDSILAATSHLLGGGCAVLRPCRTDASRSLDIRPATRCSESATGTLAQGLADLCETQCRFSHGAGRQVYELTWHTLPASQQRAIVLLMAPPPANVPLVGVALAIPENSHPTLLDQDILESFVQRVGVLLENALLYASENRLNQALREGEAQLRAVMDNVAEGLITIYANGTIRTFNFSAERMFGYSASEVHRRHFAVLFPVSDASGSARLDRALSIGALESFQPGGSLGKRKDGTTFPIDVSVRNLRLEREQLFIVSVRDISDRKRSEAQLEHLALHDILTDLPNRNLLGRRLEEAIDDAHRTQAPFALLVMDLDRFKDVNDTFGHHYGDLLLREISHRLQRCVPASGTLARLGGDEFAVLLPETNAAESVRLAQALLDTLEQPIVIDGYTMDAGLSIGIALYPVHGENSETLLRHADVAMYVAKRSGTGNAVYAADEDEHSPDRVALSSELRRAVEQDELLLHFQPKVDLQSLRVVGAEALVRWQHPERGILLPQQFVPLAEHTGLIKPLSHWVLRAAIHQLRLWHEAGIDLKMAVNLSMHDLHDADLPALIAELLARSTIAADRLIVEITESAIMRDPMRAIDVIQNLRDMGIEIAIDDFGTGYSSLTYLKRLPVTEVKIDGSFVHEMATDRSDEAIVRAVVQLGHTVGVQVVAEGVENQATWDMLVAHGCDIAQGYYISRALSAPHFVQWLQGRGNAKSTPAGPSGVRPRKQAAGELDHAPSGERIQR